jgi:hypothetical protein
MLEQYLKHSSLPFAILIGRSAARVSHSRPSILNVTDIASVGNLAMARLTVEMPGSSLLKLERNVAGSQ